MKKILLSIAVAALVLLVQSGLLVDGEQDVSNLETRHQADIHTASLEAKPQQAPDVQSDTANFNNALHQHPDGSHTHTTPTSVDSVTLEALIDKHITDAMRREINQSLKPKGKPLVVEVANGVSSIDLSERAASVVVAVLDDEYGLLVTDFTSPLPLQENAPAASATIGYGSMETAKP